MNDITKEAFELVQELNGQSWTEELMQHYEPFEFKSANTYECVIYFMGIFLWDSDNDDRDWLEDEEGNYLDEKKSLKKHIIKQAVDICSDVVARMKNIVLIESSQNE